MIELLFENFLDKQNKIANFINQRFNIFSCKIKFLLYHFKKNKSLEKIQNNKMLYHTNSPYYR